MIGLLMYLVNTRPNISFSANSLSHFMVNPRRVHWVVAKHVIHYLKGTMEYRLQYELLGGVRLIGFTDAHWAGCSVDIKSTSSCCFNLGSGVVSWFSRKHKLVALSSAEAEYMAISMVAREAISLWKILMAQFGQEMDATVIYCDNQSNIKLSENPMFHDKRKHIDI